jgi:hypothetical protein
MSKAQNDPPRVLLHVGTHKTGTTSIQSVLSRHRKTLRKQDLVYPNTRPFLRGGGEAHHRLAHGLCGINPDIESAAQRFLDHLQRTTRQGKTVLLSSEAFYRNLHGVKHWNSASLNDYWPRRRQYLSHVADSLPATDIRVILFIRRPDTFAESLYREIVTKSLTKYHFYKWLRRTQHLFCYDAQIQAFSSAFPSVQVVRYEDALTEGLVEAFFRRIGFTAPAPAPWTRRSPDARLVLWMHQRRPGTWEQRRKFVTSQEALDLFPDYGTPTLWQSAADRDAFLEQFDGTYGAEFFPPPSRDLPPATLIEDDAQRIDAAWARWMGGTAHQ